MQCQLLLKFWTIVKHRSVSCRSNETHLYARSNAVCTSVHITSLLFSFHHYSYRAGLTLFSAYLALILTPIFVRGAVRRGDMWEVLFWSTHDWITMEDSRTENFKFESFDICTASCLCSSDFHCLLNSVHNSEYLVWNVV